MSPPFLGLTPLLLTHEQSFKGLELPAVWPSPVCSPIGTGRKRRTRFWDVTWLGLFRNVRPRRWRSVFEFLHLKSTPTMFLLETLDCVFFGGCFTVWLWNVFGKKWKWKMTIVAMNPKLMLLFLYFFFPSAWVLTGVGWQRRADSWPNAWRFNLLPFKK